MIMDGEGVNIMEEKQKEENCGIFEGFLHLATELGNDYQEQENIVRFGDKGFENGQGIDLLKEVEEVERGVVMVKGRSRREVEEMELELDCIAACNSPAGGFGRQVVEVGEGGISFESMGFAISKSSQF